MCVHPFVCYQTCSSKYDILKVNGLIWCMVAQVVHEVIDFGDQEVKVQGHTSLKIDLEASLSTPVGRVGFII